MDNRPQVTTDALERAIAAILREEQDGRTDVWLAKAAKVNVQTLRRQLDGIRPMSSGVFVRVTGVLKADPSDVIVRAKARLAEEIAQGEAGTLSES